MNPNIKLSLDALLVLDAIDRRGSFAAAAETLNRVPSAITYAVRRLEEDLGVTLFDRSGYRASLTAAGERLLQEGRHLLRAAVELEKGVRHIASGWETELKIAVSDLLPLGRLQPLLNAFFTVHDGTDVRVSREVYGGTWDALASGRADLVIGTCGDAPAGNDFATLDLGEMEFAFVVSPHHPLAQVTEPLPPETLLDYRIVTAADSSRSLPPKSSAILSGQRVLAMPDMEAKLEAQRQGLGVGFIPRARLLEDLAAGTLIEKQLANPPPPGRLEVAWRCSCQRGRALEWFLQKLREPQEQARWLAPGPY